MASNKKEKVVIFVAVITIVGARLLDIFSDSMFIILFLFSIGAAFMYFKTKGTKRWVALVLWLLIFCIAVSIWCTHGLPSNQIHVPIRQIRELEGNQVITVDFILNDDVRWSWGVSSIRYELRKIEGMSISDNALEVSDSRRNPRNALFSSLLFRNRSIALFSYDFEPLADYILYIYIDDSPAQAIMLHGVN